jgi:DNA excision repair protein ERCC-2
MKTIRLSVQDFARPSPRTGHLQHSTGHLFGLERGIEIHQQIQARRRTQFADYKTEVKISHSFECEQFKFVIDGRMDGLQSGMLCRIEEIKSDFNVRELRQELLADPWKHPYGLQLLTYGYFYFQQEQRIPELVLHLVSSRNADSYDVSLSLDVPRYETWLKLRLAELVSEAEQFLKKSKRRKKMASQLSFPFAPRKGQSEFMQFIEQGIQQEKHLLLQAPTGLGKTIGVIFPLLKEALHRGARLMYVTPKNSQQLVANAAIDKFQGQGLKVKALTLTARSKLCLKSEMVCDPALCEFARDYYDKLARHDLANVIHKKKKLNSRWLRELGTKYELCPAGLQQEALPHADVIIGDYNHVFSMNSRISLSSGLLSEGLPNLAIDEAHNLPQRAMDYFSPMLSWEQWEAFKAHLDELGSGLEGSGRKLIEQAQHLILRGEQSAEFERLLEQLKQFLLACYEAEVGEKTRRAIFELYWGWATFSELLIRIAESEASEFITFRQGNGSKTAYHITCCDPSTLIRDTYKEYKNVVAFSATLRPFDFYSQLTGLSSDRLLTAEFASPYDPANRKLLIIPQISTKFSERARNYPKIAEAIAKIISLKSGNYLAFFPSFDFLEKTLACFTPPARMNVLQQERKMKPSQVDHVLDLIAHDQGHHILFAVQGGVFSEGVDYQGEMVIGAFVIGPPLPNFDRARELQKDFYQRTYQSGFAYAYSYPAMAKAVQAAGRVIRGESERGLIVLMDERFLKPEYVRSMPSDWFEREADELVSKQILKDVKSFWDSAE